MSGTKADNKLAEVRKAASFYPRCCDQWQDSLGEIHCNTCAQKTFAMLFEIQQILGINKAGKQV